MKTTVEFANLDEFKQYMGIESPSLLAQASTRRKKNQDRRIISNLFNPVKLHNFLCYTFFILSIVMMIMAASLIEFGHSAGAYLLAAIFAMISIFNIICFAAVNDNGGDYRE